MSYVEELINEFGHSPLSDFRININNSGDCVTLDTVENPYVDMSNGDPVLELLHEQIGITSAMDYTHRVVSVSNTTHNIRWCLYTYFKKLIVRQSNAKKPAQTKAYKDFVGNRHSYARKIEFLLRLYRHLETKTITPDTALLCIKLFWNERI